MNVTATILPRVIVHLPEGPFLVNASTDEVSILDMLVGASTVLSSRFMAQLPPYRWTADTLLLLYVPDSLELDPLLYRIGGPPIHTVPYYSSDEFVG